MYEDEFDDEVMRPSQTMTDALEHEQIADSGGRSVPCAFVTGVAGTGKTTLIKKRIEEDPDYAVLSATTGIAAVNLGCITLNALLGYFDEDSLRDLYLSGRLGSKLRDLVRDKVRNLLVEEVSMLTAPALDILYRGAQDTAGTAPSGIPLGLILVGDFCQLPPVKGRWAFEADCWPEFAAATERLDKVWRQDQPGFLEALNLARSGRGAEAAEVLEANGARWETSLALEFDGTTIVPKNDMVDRYNAESLSRLPGKLESPIRSRRWGKQRGEWKNIPDELRLKVGAYVMCLTNSQDFSVVNGDCGHVVETGTDDEGEFVAVELIRTKRIANIHRIVRNVEHKDRPSGPCVEDKRDARQFFETRSGAAWLGMYYSASGKVSRRRWITGQCEYMPLRLAYASTVHKSQGLSLDRVQIDYRNQFFKSPAMLYTSLSRCRTIEGLRLVGGKDRFADHCRIDERVRPWL